MPLPSYWPSILDFEPNFLRPLTIRHFWAVLPPILNVIFRKTKSGGSIPVAEYRPHYVDLLRCQLPRRLPGQCAAPPAACASPNIVPPVFDRHHPCRAAGVLPPYAHDVILVTVVKLLKRKFRHLHFLLLIYSGHTKSTLLNEVARWCRVLSVIHIQFLAQFPCQSETGDEAVDESSRLNFSSTISYISSVSL